MPFVMTLWALKFISHWTALAKALTIFDPTSHGTRCIYHGKHGSGVPKRTRARTFYTPCFLFSWIILTLVTSIGGRWFHVRDVLSCRLLRCQWRLSASQQWRATRCFPRRSFFFFLLTGSMMLPSLSPPFQIGRTLTKEMGKRSIN